MYHEQKSMLGSLSSHPALQGKHPLQTGVFNTFDRDKICLHNQHLRNSMSSWLLKVRNIELENIFHVRTQTTNMMKKLII